MARVLDLRSPIALYSAESYPRTNEQVRSMGLSGGRNAEMRAMTIAAFRIAQNNNQLSQQPMNVTLLEFLVANSVSAVGHWLRESRLQRSAETYQLTPSGITECQNTLLGLSGNYSTTESKVQEWVNRMLRGDRAASRSHIFQPAFWVNT